MGELVQRFRMDRRRLEDAHIQFALLQVVSWYPEQFHVTSLALHAQTRESLSEVSSKYHGVFMSHYASEY